MSHNRSNLLLLTALILVCGETQGKNFSNDKYKRNSARITYSSKPEQELPIINMANTAIVEGNSGQRSAHVVVSISRPATEPISILFHTSNGTAVAGSDYVARSDSATFNRGEFVTRISIPIIGDLSIEPDETFRVTISKVIGAVFTERTDSVSNITIINDDFKGANAGNTKKDPNAYGGVPNLNLGGRKPTIYEVRLTHTGYTSFFTAPGVCPIRADGKVVLYGLVWGFEDVASDEDIRYTGTLQLDIDMDICSVTGDPAKECGITVIGSGPVKTELEIYFDNRGGYVKVENTSGRFLRGVSGSCDAAQSSEEKSMIPNKTIATIFNGRDLPMLTMRTLRVGRFVETDGGNETVVEVIQAIRP